MQSALALLDIRSTPISWIAALQSLGWLLYSFAALILLIGYSALWLWQVRPRTRAQMRPWLGAMTIALSLAVEEIFAAIDNMRGSNFVWSLCISGGLTIIGLYCLDRIVRLRNLDFTERPPYIPPVPDGLAARRAINHRPYRRRGAHPRWR